MIYVLPKNSHQRLEVDPQCEPEQSPPGVPVLPAQIVKCLRHSVVEPLTDKKFDGPNDLTFAPDADIVFKRLAVLPEQIETWNLPTRPTKQSDSRAKKFGDRPSVELDAIHPEQLRGLVEDAITQHMPSERFDELMAEQAGERRVMREWAERMGAS